MSFAIAFCGFALLTASSLRAEVVTTRTNVYTGPSHTASIAYKLSRGKKVQVYEVRDGWARISELGSENSHWVIEHHLAEKLGILCCGASEGSGRVWHRGGRIVFENIPAPDDEQTTSPDPPDCR